MFKTRHQPVWLRLKRPAKFAFTPSLPRTAVLPVLLWAIWPPAAHAQTHHVDAPERVTRAVGVYEWTGELAKPTAARFVPVSLYIDGHMQDAGLYLARPVPFALQTGDLYALEHAGEPEGLLDLDYAQRVVTGGALAEDAPAAAWYGYGKFTPEAAPKPAAALRPSSHLPVIQANGVPATTTSPATDDGRPHMSRRDTAPAAANPTSTSPGNPGSPNSGSPNSGSSNPGTPQSSSTPDPANSGGQTKADSGTTASGSTDTDDTDRPTLRHRDPSQDAARRREYGTKAKQASVTAVGPAPGDDPDRPMLGHNTAVDDSTPPLTGLPAGLHQAVAVSDPVHRDTHNFARDWDSPEERTETLAALEALARPRVRAYLTANALTPSNGPLPAEVDTSGPASTHTPATAPAAGTSATPTPDNLHPANAHPDSTDPDIPPPPKLQRGVPTQYRSSATATPAAPAPAPASAAPTPTSSPAPPPPAPHSAAAPPAATAAPRPAVRPGTHRPTRPASLQTASLLLAQGEVTGFSLSYGGLPTFVYTAAAAVTKPTTAPATSSALKPGPGTIAHPAVYVTLVAQRLPSGELQVVMSSVTDSLHLDRSPRMRLVDAVDPDGSHRASLLFELRAASSRQFALYRLTSVQAEQTFTTASIE